MIKTRFSVRSSIIVALMALAPPATAQFGESAGYKFLQAVKDAKGDEVTEALNKPGSTIVNTRDINSRETALHIVAKRSDATYTRFLLQHGADPNLRDSRGNTPLMVAVELGADGVVNALIEYKANVNLGNDGGETPLIRAVQRRDLELVRVLLAAGADPDQADSLAGQSARGYAQADTRSPEIKRLIDATPKRVRKAVAGPKL
ncbi:ankyrin repeat domain-containing protein [Sphingomonas sp. GlSt437]|uniref:ankyrin repeat domain-containing protein n=1 Tax=Sphingomonas sp. GlSt437 TaxID=3389970 RepID=UPI003A869CAD